MTRIGDILARTVKVRQPSWARDADHFINVVIEPSSTRWDYVPRGPFTLIRWSQRNSDSIYGCETHVGLGACLTSFARLHLPRHNQMCAIIDEDRQLILGWGQGGKATGWTGCEVAFKMLETYHNPVDVAFWEANARERVIAETGDRIG